MATLSWWAETVLAVGLFGVGAVCACLGGVIGGFMIATLLLATFDMSQEAYNRAAFFGMALGGSAGFGFTTYWLLSRMDEVIVEAE